MSSAAEMVSRERSMSYPVYKLYKRRFYILFLFSFVSFNQCLIWITFGPISESAKKHYNISDGTVDLLLAWGPIFFIPCLPLAYTLLNRRNGLRYCVLLLSIIDVLSTVIRVIPLIFVSSTDPRYSSISLPFLHIGQILNAACGPLAMAPVSQLSCLWFDTNERTRATTIAIMAYNLGSTTGFLLGPFVVSSPEYVPHLLYIHIGLSVVACILILIHFPGQPLTPPSPAAELLIKNPKSEQHIKSIGYYTKSLQECIKNRSFVLLVCAGGLIGGTYAAWTSLFDTILTPENYTETESGWFGFCSSVAEIIGGLILSFIADMPRFNHSFKIMIVIPYICYFLSVLWFNLSIHTIFSDQKILPSNSITIGVSVGLAGFFQGAASPLTYEAIAEFMYPLPESLSASILVELINITSLILFFIAPERSEIMNFTILIIIFICIILVILTKFNYKRRDADIRTRSTLVPADIDPFFDMIPIDTNQDISLIDTLMDTIQMDPIQNTTLTNSPDP